MGEKIIFWINKFLLVDVLVVFAFFVWFVVANMAELWHIHLGLKLWQSLWMPVIQPAIGLVMLGAIAIGIGNRLSPTNRTPKN
jgi:hypothetical protein